MHFKGHFGYEEANKIAQSIEDNFWEYSFKLRGTEDVKTRVSKAYYKFSPTLASILEKCDVFLKGGEVVIHVPDPLKQFVGRLIGRQGANIRAVEAELGIRVKILQSSPPPEEVELKKKLQMLLRNLTIG
ncbi:MAG: KH domain-containing protein [Candidatus Bathyarchaeia archaeon]